MGELTDLIGGLKQELLARIDLNAKVPGLNVTVNDLFGDGGLEAVLSGDVHTTNYVQMYAQQHPLDDWNRITFTNGLIKYLNEHWIPTLPGVGSEGNGRLTLALTEAGFEVGFVEEGDDK